MHYIYDQYIKEYFSRLNVSLCDLWQFPSIFGYHQICSRY
jgi:hypothetical protein